jgi:hypothetical protein
VAALVASVTASAEPAKADSLNFGFYVIQSNSPVVVTVTKGDGIDDVGIDDTSIDDADIDDTGIDDMVLA